MQFNELKKGLKEIPFDSLRVDSESYFEGVIVKSELSKLVDRLNNTFGTPVWPSKERLPADVRQVISGFGGIMAGQTLYFWKQGDNVIFAMLWPWQDGVHTTLKVVKK